MSSSKKYEIKKVHDYGSYLRTYENDKGETIAKIYNRDDPNFDPTTRTYIQYQNFDKNGEVKIGGIIKKNIIVERKQTKDHPVFGRYSERDTINNKYSMVFQIEREPTFSRSIYRKYWDYLIYRVDRGTNAIYYMRGHLIVLATIKKQLAKICHMTPKYYSSFHNELLVKGYMAEITLNGCKYYLMNPLYIRNGNPLTEIVYTLFGIK